MKKNEQSKIPVIESLEQRLLFSADIPLAGTGAIDSQDLPDESQLSLPGQSVSNGGAVNAAGQASAGRADISHASTVGGDTNQASIDASAKQLEPLNSIYSGVIESSESLVGRDALALDGLELDALEPDALEAGGPGAEALGRGDFHSTKSVSDHGAYSLSLTEFDISASGSNDTIDALVPGTPDSPAQVISSGAVPQSIRNEIVFLDLQAEDTDFLLREIYSQIADNVQLRVVTIDTHEAGIDKITNTFAEITEEVDAVHIVSHGSDGSVQLGNQVLDSKELAADSTKFSGWSFAFSDDADLLIYGCNVAASAEGRQFAASLAEVTGADIAASDDLTGYVSLGGDWDLEFASGTIETASLLSNDVIVQWRHSLQIYTVLNTADSGADSMRQAILDANANPGLDIIQFNIAAVGPHLISPLTSLPQITDLIFIDGWSEPDYANDGVPVITIDGTSASGDGIVLAAGSDGSVVRGLSVIDFTMNGIALESSINWIYGNYLGVEVDGASVAGNNDGLGIKLGSDNNRIGTDGDANNDDLERNVISGNNSSGIKLHGVDSTGNIVDGNYIGVSADGKKLVGNGDDGILLQSGANDSQILDNLVVGSGLAGIRIDGVATGNVIQGNIIGTDTTGYKNWGSKSSGIVLENGASNTLVGGTAAGEGNVVAFSGQHRFSQAAGVLIENGSSGNSVRGNSIHSNLGAGIDLSATTGVDGADLNDVSDGDAGGNNKQNWAILKSVLLADDGALTFELDTSMLTAGSYTVDFYATVSRDGGQVEGERYLGTLAGVAGGISSYTGTLAGLLLAKGEFVTVTTTDAVGNSSEFSTYAMVMDGDSDNASPEDIKIISTSGGVASINKHIGNGVYLIADDGDALLGGRTSLSYEVQFATTPGSVYLPLLSYAVPNNHNELAFGVNSSGNALLHVGADTITSTAFDYSALLDGLQHSLGFTWNGSTGHWVIYADGVEVDSTTISGGTLLAHAQAIDSGGVLLFGQEQGSVEGGFDISKKFAGALYNNRLFSDVRTAEEMLASYRGGLAYDEPGLLAQWVYNELSVEGEIADTVGGNNLTAKHVSEVGYSARELSLTFAVDEHPTNGTVIGSIYGLDPQREAQISALLAADTDLRYHQEHGKFYKLVTNDVTWPVANAAALAANLEGVMGQLATIRSASEQELISSFIGEMAEESWLGARDATVEGEWRWQSDGNDADQFWQSDHSGYAPNDAYANFHPYRPNNAGGIQHNLYASIHGQWNDTHNTHVESYIVEWDAESVIDTSQALVYSIVAQTVAGAFEIDSDTGEIRVLDGALVDADAHLSHTISVRVTDVDGNTYDEDIEISLNRMFDDRNPVSALTSGMELNTDGGNDAYLIADDGGAVLGGLSALTLETTFITNNKSADTVLLSYAAGDANGNDLLVFLNGSSLHFLLNGVSSTHSGMDYSLLADGQQHSVALSWENWGGSFQIYVDGEFVEAGTGKATGEILSGSAGTGELVLGLGQPGPGEGFSSAQYFDGVLYDVRIWDEVRSAAEIAANYRYKIAASSAPAALIANWQMDGFNAAGEIVDVINGNNLSPSSVTTELTSWSNSSGGVFANHSMVTFDSSQNANAWGSAQVNSPAFNSLGFTDDYTMSFSVDQLLGYRFMVGLGLMEFSASPADIDYAMYFDVNAPGDIAVFENGTSVFTANLNYAVGDEFSFYVNGTNLEYQHNGVTFYTALILENQSWYVDTAFHGTSGGVTNERPYSLSNFRLTSGNSTGFISSTIVEDLRINEHAINGTRVGFVVPSEVGSLEDMLSDGSFRQSANGTTTSNVGSWDVIRGSVDIIWPGALSSPQGGQVVDLNGLESGAIKQTLATDVGRQYQVVFTVSGNAAAGDEFKDLRISAAGQSQNYTREAPTGWSMSNPLWSNYAFTFTASDTLTELIFSSLDENNAYGAFITDVQVMEIPLAITTILNTDSTLSYSAATDKFYRFVAKNDDFATQLAAATSAALNGVAGGLVRIESPYENNLIRQYALDSGSNIWLGATDANNDGNWNWLDGPEESGDQFWINGSGGSPVDGFFSSTFSQSEAAGEDYVRLSSDGTWVDDTASTENAYVIEWRASEVLAAFDFSITSQSEPLFNIEPTSGEITLVNPAAPDAFTDHVMWLDASDTPTVTTSGAEVVGIVDKSLSGNFADYGAGVGPELVPATMNDLDAMYFNGIDTRLSIADSVDLNLEPYDQKTITVALQTSTDTNSKQVIYEEGATNGGLNIYLYGNQLHVGAYTSTDDWNGEWLSATVATDTSYIVSLAFNHKSNSFSFYLNGELVGRSAAPSPISKHTGNIGIGAVNDKTKFHDGDFFGSEAYWFNGFIGEITYNNTALASDDIVNLHAHLMNKWIGTATALDYETAAAHSIVVQATDAGGVSTSEPVTITVVNGQEPVQTLPPPQTISGAALVFSSGTATEVSVSDTINTSSALMRLKLLVNDGVLNLSQTTGLTFVEGSNVSSALVIDGSESDINAALDGMTFTPDENFLGVATLDVTTALAANLAGMYTFSGGNATDQSAGAANDGTFNGAATTLIDGERGEVLALDGSVGTDVQIMGGVGQPNSLTVATWVNADSADAEVISLSDVFSIRADDVSSGGKVTAFYHDGFALHTAVSTQSIVGTGWRHLAATFDNSSKILTLYIDGSEAATVIGVKSIGYLGGDAYLGSHNGSSHFLDGLIDDTRVYGRALSADEVAALSVDQTDTSDSLVITVIPVNGSPTFKTPITIDNHSFETEVLPFDGSRNTSVTDWITTGTATGVLNVEPVAFPAEAPDGRNTGYIDNGGAISQTTSAIFSAGTDYELTVAVGDSATSLDSVGWEIRLFAGTQLLGSASTIDINPADGTFEDVTLSLTAAQLDANSAFYGESIRVELYDSGTSEAVHFDDVRLTQRSSLVTMPDKSFVPGGEGVILNEQLEVFDQEISDGVDTFENTTLTLSRDGGANSEDVFTASGLLEPLIENGNLVYNSIIVGTVTTHIGGVLVLTFNASADNTAIDSVMQAIAYQNSSATPPASVQINWSFSDNNNASVQGSGGDQIATGSTIVYRNYPVVAVANVSTATEAGGIANATAGVDPTGNVLANDTDADFGDSKTVVGAQAGTHSSVSGSVGVAVAGAYGSIIIGSDGSYSYTVDNNLAVVQALRNAGHTITDTFSYTVRDGAGAESTTQLTVAIQGQNDAPDEIASTRYLSDLTATAISNISDGLKNDQSQTGTEVVLDGVAYPKAIATVAPLDAGSGYVEYAIDGATSFKSSIGLTSSAGSVIYRVYVDGILQFTSPTLSGSSDTIDLDIDTTGGSTLRLEVDNADGSSVEDYAVWANARFVGGTVRLSIDERAVIGSVAGSVNRNDTDWGDNANYTLIDDAGGRFVIDGGTGEISVADESRLDYEVHESHAVTVLASDVGGETFDGDVVITINDVNEPPLAIYTSRESIAIGNHSFEATVLAEDQFNATVPDWIVAGGAGHWNPTTSHFASGDDIDGSNVAYANVGSSLSQALGGNFDSSLDYQLQVDVGNRQQNDNGSEYRLRLYAGSTVVGEHLGASGDAGTWGAVSLFVDGDGFDSVDGQALSIELASISGTQTNFDNVRLSAFSTDGLTVNENAVNGTVVATATGLDLDNGASLTYSLIDSAGGRFAIDSSSALITVADSSLLDYEVATTHDIVVEVSDGTNTESEALAISVTDSSEPTQSVPGAQNVSEDAVLTFNAINGNAVTVSDGIAGSEVPLQVVLAVNDGVLNLSGVAGITFVAGSDGSGSLVFNGTESAINTALDGMTFTADANFNGSVTLSMVTGLAADLEGRYAFTGGNAIDHSAGLSQNGILNSGATIVDIGGTRGEVLSLSGAGEGVHISGMFSNPGDITLSAWVNLLSADTRGSDIISLGDNVVLRSDGSSSGTSLGVSGFFHDGSGFRDTVSGEFLAGKGWHHVAYSINDTTNTQRLYIDGMLVGETSFLQSIAYARGVDTYLGTHGNFEVGADLNGQIDDARIYTRALSAQEVSALARDNYEASGGLIITVDPINDAPAVTVNDFELIEGQASIVTLSMLSATDVETTDSELSVTVSNVTNGQFELASMPQAKITSFTQAQIAANQVLFVHNGAEYAPTFDIVLSDGGVSTEPVAANVTFTSVNDAPILVNLAGYSANTTNDNTWVFLDRESSAALLDNDQPANYDGATLSIVNTGYQIGDLLRINTAGSISISENMLGVTVSVDGITVGTLSVYADNNITVEFNASSSVNDVNTLLRAIDFASTSTVMGSRAIEFDFNDNDGTVGGGVEQSNTATSYVSVIEAGSGIVTTDEDTNYIFELMDFQFSGTSVSEIESITITTLPALGTLLLNSVAVTGNQAISAAEIAAGHLIFTPFADDNSGAYASFDFYVNHGNSSINVMAGEASQLTLSGGFFQALDQLLSSAQNFGPTGAVSSGISVVPSSDTIDMSYLSSGEVLFHGYVNSENSTVSELNDIEAWVQAGGILISTSDFSGFDAISEHYGLSVTPTFVGNWEVADQSHPIMNGPFGLVGTNGSVFSTSGTVGYFSAGVLPSDTVIATDPIGNPTMLLRQDGNGIILFTADEGIFRANMSGGGVISTANDRLSANMFAWAISQVAFSEIYTLNIAVDPINDDAFNAGSLPSNLIALEDTVTSVNISNLTLADIDAASGSLTLTISTSGGTLNASNTTGLSVSGNNSGNLSLTGMLASLNAWIDDVGSLSYIGAANMNGISSDDISFSVTDNGNTGAGGGNILSLGSIDVDIDSINDAPSGSSKTVTLLEDNDYIFSAADFGFSDVSDGDNFQAVVVDSVPATGQLLFNSFVVSAGDSISVSSINSSQFTFRPGVNDNGSAYASFTFRVQDDGGTSLGGSNIDALVRTITFDVSSVNDAPSGSSSSISTLEDTDYVFTLLDFGFSDSNDGDEFLAVQIFTLSDKAQLILSGVPVLSGASVLAADISAGKLIFRPAANDSGIDYAFFDFRVQDDGGIVNGGSDVDAVVRIITIDVISVNDPPMGADNTVSTLEDTDYVFSVADFGFTDVNDGDSFISITFDTLPVLGNLLLSNVVVNSGDSISTVDVANGNLVYRPVAQANGSVYAGFTFRVQDDSGTDHGGSDIDASSRTMSIDVIGVNDAPTGTSSTVTVVEDVNYVFGVADFGFADVNDGDALLAVIIDTLPALGTLLLNNSPVTNTDSITVSSIADGHLIYRPVAHANGSAYSSFSFRVQDNGGTANGGNDVDTTARTLTIDITSVNDAPRGTSNTVVTNEDTDYTFIADDFGFSDAHDDDNFLAVTIDDLPATGQLLLNGIGISAGSSHSVADIALGRLVFRPDADDNGAGSADFTFRVQDDGGTSFGVIDMDPTVRTMTIDVLSVNDAPVLSSLEASILVYIENDVATTVTSTLELHDLDDSQLENAVVAIIGGYQPGEDVLSFVDTATISGSWNVISGELTLTGSDSVAAYQAALRTVSYHNTSDDPVALTRTVSFTVSDGELNSHSESRHINVSSLNDAPELTGVEVPALVYTENDSATQVSASITLSELDDSHLETAIVTMGAGYQIGEDVLSFVDTATISSDWNEVTGELTLTGSDTIAAYQLALRAVTYQNLSDRFEVGTRSVSFIVNDGEFDSNITLRNIDIIPVNDAPQQSSIEITALDFAENSAVLAISSTLNISDVDSTHLKSAVVTVGSGYQLGEDVLGFVNTGTITSNWVAATGQLVLFGADTVAAYQSALRAVTYQNTSDNPNSNSRTILFSVNDGELDSNVASRLIHIAPANDAPQQGGIESTAVNYIENDGAVVITSSLNVYELDDTHLERAIVSIVDGYQPSEDILAFTDTAAITGSWNAVAGELTLVGVDTVAAYQAALRSVTYENSSDNLSANGRTITFVVNDGELDSNVLARIINIVADNDAPTLANIEAHPITYSENQGAISVTSGLIVSELDDARLESAIVRVSGNFVPEEDVLAFSDTATISANWDGATGALTLTGSDSLAAYQAALRSVSYENSSERPSDLVRSITIVVYDGELDSNTVTRDIDILSVNDKPFDAGQLPVSVTIVEDTTSVVDLASVELQDVDAGEPADNLTLSVSTDSGGVLQVVDSGGLTVTGNPGNAIAITGNLSALNSWLNTVGTLRYSPVSQVNGVGADNLNIQISDNGNVGIGGGSAIDIGSVRIDIVSVNDAPFGTDATLQTDEDQSIILTVDDFGFNDGNDDNIGNKGGSNSFIGVLVGSLPIVGSLTLDGSPVLVGATVSVDDIQAGLFAYTPDLDGHGQPYAHFDFHVQDSGGTNNSGVDIGAVANRITFDVVSINDAPKGGDSTVTTAEDIDYIIQLTDLGFSDLSDDDSFHSIEIASLPVNGSLTLNGVEVATGQKVHSSDIAGGSLVFSPDAQTYGKAHSQIGFKVIDDGGLPGIDVSISTNTLTIDVTGVNDAPTGTDRTVVADEDVPYLFSVSDFGFADANDLTDSLSAVRISSLPEKGQLTLSDSAVEIGDVIDIEALVRGEFQYQAALHENGSNYSQFLFQVQDNNNQPGDNTDPIPNKMAISILPISDAPEGQDGFLNIFEDNDYVLQVSDFGYSDLHDGDDLVGVFIDQLPSSGQLLLYKVADVTDELTLVDGSEVTTGQFVTEADISDGLLIYRPNVNVHGSDEFKFRLQDSGVDSSIGLSLLENVSTRNTIDIEVVSVNDAPSGSNNTVTTSEDTPHVFRQVDFGFSDPRDSSQASDNEHRFTAITIFSLPDVGTLKFNGVITQVGQVVTVAEIDAGLLVYSPPENETGSGYNGFGFQVHDSAGTANGGVDIDPTPNFISFDLPGVNDPPLLVSEGATVAEGGEVLLTEELLYGADADDLDPLELSLTITRVPVHGELKLSGITLGTGDTFTLQAILDNQLSYIHDESETLADAFGVAVKDGGEDGTEPDSGDFELKITEVIDPAPVLENDLLELSFGEDFSSLDGDLLASGFSGLNHDSLLDNSRFTVELEVPPLHGIVELRADGTFDYAHDGSRILQDEFRYRVTNEDGVFTIATVLISIEPPLDSAFSGPATVVSPIPPNEPEPEPETERSPTSQQEENADSEKGQLEPEADLFGGPSNSKSASEGEVSALAVLRNLQNGSDQAQAQSQFSRDGALRVVQHSKVELATLNDDELSSVSSATVELLLEVKVPTAKEVVGNPGFLDGLRQLDEDLKEAENLSGARFRLAEDTVMGVSLSMTVGVLAWALRGGAVFTSLMAVAPLWASIDLSRVSSPVVLSSKENEAAGDKDQLDDHSLEEIFDRG